jgi:hypothetical protein
MFGFHSLNRWLLDEAFPQESTLLSPVGREVASALFVGVEASLLLSPLELVRIQGQNRGKGGLLSASRFTLEAIGIKGLLSTGMHACMQREAKYCLGQFAAIGAASRALDEWAESRREKDSGSLSTQSSTSSSSLSQVREVSSDAVSSGGGGGGGGGGSSGPVAVLARVLHESPDLRVACSSVMVGVMCTVVSHPDDVIKTRQQTRLATSASSSVKHVAGAAAADVYTIRGKVSLSLPPPSFSSYNGIGT